MTEFAQALLSGLVRPLGPAAPLCLAWALCAGAIARPSLRAGGLLLLGLSALGLLADTTSLLREPHLVLRALCGVVLAAHAAQWRWPIAQRVGGYAALAGLVYCLPAVPAPMHSLLEPAWPDPPARSLAFGLALGTALTLSLIAWLAARLPRPLAVAAISLSSLLALCTLFGLTSLALRWLLLRWPLPLWG